MSRNDSSTFILLLCLLALFTGYCINCKAQTTHSTDIVITSGLTESQYRSLDPDSAMAYFKKLVQHSVVIDSPDGAFYGLIEIGIKYYEKQEFPEYREYSEASIPWAKRASQKDAVAWAYNNIAESYYYQGDYLRASENLYIALQELNKATTEFNHTGANIYNNLGRINIRLNQPDKALTYFATAEDISKRGELYFQLGETYTELGRYYNSIHQPDSARKYFMQVMDLGKKINKVDLQAIANCDLGKTAIETGDYEQAMIYLQQATSLAKGIYDYIVIDALYAMGDALCHEGKYKEAEAILISALQETKQHNIKDRYIDGYTKLIAVYKATGQYKNALDYMDTLSLIKDSLTSISKATAYNQLEIKYQTAEKDKQIAQNQLLITKQKSKIIGENIWIGAIAGSIFLLGIILISIYRNARNKERLQAEQIKSLQQQNKIGTLNAVVQGEENERGRIARELHDGIGGMLAAAMMRFMTIRHDNEAITKSRAYVEAMKMLDQMGDEIRKTAHNLMPEVLQKQDLSEAVRSFCNYMQEEGSLQIDFQSYGAFENFSQDIKLNIYRILQELLKNIKQHAHATHALVQLVMNEQTMTITIEDNGSGFDINEIKSGIGLRNMETRVHSLGGNYTIESEEGKGTTVFIEFELPQALAN